MRIADKAIVLQNIRRSDNQYILKLFTNHNGFITAATRTGRLSSSKVRTAHIQPLNLIDAQFVLRQNREIQRLTEASAYHANTGILQSFTKLGIAQFINEVLIKCIKEQHPNPHLFNFVETCILYLNDSEVEYINLHLYLLIGLTRYFGFEPQNNFSSNNLFFDCGNGCFSPQHLPFPMGLDAETSLLFSEFLKVNSLRSKFSNQQRRCLLETLLAYYKLHVPGFNNLRSVEVLKEIVSA